jgi:Protein of unknown function (DUF2924)
MSDAVEAEVEALARLGLEGLRQAWRSRYGAPPPLRSAELLRLALAWRIQAAAFGGLDPATRGQLRRVGPIEVEGRALGVGAKLRRTWKGAVVEVEVAADGFRWNGALYPSLSAAATAIAGTRWNGPRFFGLRESAT